MIKKYFIERLFFHADIENVILYLMDVLRKYSLSKSPSDSLKFLLTLNNEIYTLTGQEAMRYGDGIHTKHRHIKYHEFFIRNIHEGETVFDIGCGNGALAHDVVSRFENVSLTGIDMNDSNISFAKQTYSHPRLEFCLGNALTDLPGKSFDVVILSNVLEHLENRVDFLLSMKKVISPKRVLLRVPLFERDWRVPLMKELGIDYRLDKTHFVEYVQEEFEDEIKKAGYSIGEKEFRWGELWCVAK